MRRHSPRSCCALCRAGFTLVEMLVAFGVVGVLAALVIPAAGRAMGSARSAECASNLRNLGSAFALYAAENNQVIPVWFTDVDGNTGDKDWYHLEIAPFIEAEEGRGLKGQQASATELFSGIECPAIPAGYGLPFRDQQGGSAELDYAVNYSLEQSQNGLGRPTRLLDIAKPSQTVYLTCGYAVFYPESGQDTEFRIPEAPRAQAGTPPQSQRIYFPHDGRTNALFLDGHVESLAAPISPDITQPFAP